MNAQLIKTVRIHPPKFWSATKGMTQPEIERMMHEIMDSVEKGDFGALSKYDFVAVEHRDN